MNREGIISAQNDEMKSRARTLSPAGVKALDRLKEGSAYWVRDKWRFRGGRGRARTSTIDLLLGLGLAQRLDKGSVLEIRITPVGRSALSESRVGSR